MRQWMRVFGLFAWGWGCGSGGQPASDELQEPRAVEADAPGTVRGVPGAAPQPGMCPGSHPVVCPDGCCPAGTSCGAEGCERPGTAGDCPAVAPVVCTADVTCAAGCTTYDSSPQGNHALLSLPAAFAPGRFGRGVVTGQMAEAAADIVAPAAGFPLGAGPITVEAWLRTGDASRQAVFGYGLGSGDQARAIVLDAGWVEWATCTFTPSIPLADDEWHFVAATYDLMAALFVDGVLVGTCLPAGPLDTQTAGAAIGNFDARAVCSPPGCLPFHGQLDELRVLDFAATGAQIAGDAAGPMTAIPGTVALFHFDEDAAVRCCPAGAACAADGGCELPATGSTCPAGTSVCTAAGECCPAGSTCTASGCIVPVVGPAECTGATPVPCGAPGRCCPSGWTCDGGCVPPSSPTVDPGSCAAGGPACGAGCCDLGDECYAFLPLCCPAAIDYVCYSSTGATVCCPITCYGFGELCMALPGAGSCPAPTVSCDDQCCPAGTTCTGDGCALDTTDLGCTGSDLACGTTCCPASSTCGPGDRCVRDDEAPPLPAGEVECPAGGYSCPPGDRCTSDGCAYDGTRPPVTGVEGPPCGAGFCGADEVCVDGVCCPPSLLEVCGGECCHDGGCAGGMCGCAPGETVCGGWCCAGPCVDGTCVLTCEEPAFPEPCVFGDRAECCATGISCSAGGCACGTTHPIECSTFCCLPGAACVDGDCQCPGGRVACGTKCCPEGEICSAGECSDRPEGECASVTLVENTTSLMDEWSFVSCPHNGGGLPEDRAGFASYVTSPTGYLQSFGGTVPVASVYDLSPGQTFAISPDPFDEAFAHASFTADLYISWQAQGGTITIVSVGDRIEVQWTDLYMAPQGEATGSFYLSGTSSHGPDL